MTTSTTTVRIKVPPQVVRIVGKQAPRDLQLSAARGALPLAAIDLLTVFFFFGNGKDPELKSLSRASLHELPISLLEPVVADPQVNPQILHFLVRERITEQRLIEIALQNPATGDATFMHCAKHCAGPILSMIAENSQRITTVPELVDAIINNSKADRALKFRLGWVDPDADKLSAGSATEAAETVDVSDSEDSEEAFGEIEEEDEKTRSKYQQALELGVAEKIKMGLTGDKEWRSLLLRDSNKLVSAAVLKNPRITEGEVLFIAKNKTTSDELIRIILLNRDWVKNYAMKIALMRHPRTPVNKALRFMSILSLKDLKDMAKSKDISAVLANNARRIIMMKEKRGG